MKRKHVVIGLIVCLTAIAATGWAKGFFKVGEPAPLFSLTSVAGQQESPPVEEVIVRTRRTVRNKTTVDIDVEDTGPATN